MKNIFLKSRNIALKKCPKFATTYLGLKMLQNLLKRENDILEMFDKVGTLNSQN